jgi:hypothetical protein
MHSGGLRPARTQSASRASRPIRPPRNLTAVARLMRLRVMAEIFDLLLDAQLLSFQSHDNQVIDRAMATGFGDFLFKILMLPFQIAQLDLYHLDCLLPMGFAREASEIPGKNSLT